MIKQKHTTRKYEFVKKHVLMILVVSVSLLVAIVAVGNRQNIRIQSAQPKEGALMFDPAAGAIPLNGTIPVQLKVNVGTANALNVARFVIKYPAQTIAVESCTQDPNFTGVAGIAACTIDASAGTITLTIQNRQEVGSGGAQTLATLMLKGLAKGTAKLTTSPTYEMVVQPLNVPTPTPAQSTNYTLMQLGSGRYTVSSGTNPSIVQSPAAAGRKNGIRTGIGNDNQRDGNEEENDDDKKKSEDEERENEETQKKAKSEERDDEEEEEDEDDDESVGDRSVQPTASVTVSPTGDAVSQPSTTPGPGFVGQTGATPPAQNLTCDPAAIGTPECLEIWRQEYEGILNTTVADFDGDGAVTFADFELWQQEFLATVPQMAFSLCAPPAIQTTACLTVWMEEYTGASQTKTADWSGDGRVSLLDFALWRQSFVQP